MTPTVLTASVPLLEPPGWALAQRELFDLLDYAWRSSPPTSPARTGG